MNSLVTSTMIVFLSAMLLLSLTTTTQGAAVRSGLTNPALTEAVLAELLDTVRYDASLMEKRGLELGYGNRYRAASSVGSKLMALKQAADWNGPGRKRRSAGSDSDVL